MPNWVTNYLKVNKKDLFFILDKNDKIDFNLSKRMPESLDVEAGGYNEIDMYLFLSDKLNIDVSLVKKDPIVIANIKNAFSKDWIKEISLRAENEWNNWDDDKKKAHFENGKKLVDNYQKYGAINWYEWCIKYWGTKWNASNSHVKDVDDNNVMITFNTAWSPPGGWLESLYERKIPFHLEWIEEQGFHGEFIYDGINEPVANELPFVTCDDDENCEENEDTENTDESSDEN